jgi:hypothetical protein
LWFSLRTEIASAVLLLASRRVFALYPALEISRKTLVGESDLVEQLLFAGTFSEVGRRRGIQRQPSVISLLGGFRLAGHVLPDTPPTMSNDKTRLGKHGSACLKVRRCRWSNGADDNYLRINGTRISLKRCCS